MSELKLCPFCGTDVVLWGQDIRNEQVVDVIRHPPFTKCPLETLIFTVDAWNTRHDPNPWRYPSRGELPEPNGVVLATWENGDGQDVVYASNVRQNPQVYRAWKRLGTDAPKLEEEK